MVVLLLMSLAFLVGVQQCCVLHVQEHLPCKPRKHAASCLASAGSRSQRTGCDMAAVLITAWKGRAPSKHSASPSPVTRFTCMEVHQIDALDLPGLAPCEIVSVSCKPPLFAIKHARAQSSPILPQCCPP